MELWKTSLIIIVVATIIALAAFFVLKNPEAVRARRKFLNVKDAETAFIEQTENTKKAIQDVGFDEETTAEFLADLGLPDPKGLKEKINCLVYPDEQGACPNESFIISESGCCELKNATGGGDALVGFVKEMAVGHVVGEAAETFIKYVAKQPAELMAKHALKQSGFVVKQGVKQGTKQIVNQATGEVIEFATEQTTEQLIKQATKLAAKKASQKSVETGVKVAAKTAVKTSFAKMISQLIAKIIKKIIAILTSRIAAMVFKMAVAVATGIGAAYAAMDALSMFLDFMDFSGYNLYSSNSVNVKLRNSLEYNYQKMMVEAGMTYPQLLDISMMYPEEHKLATQNMQTKMMGELITTVPPNQLMALIEGDPSTDVIVQNYSKENHLKINQWIYDDLLELIPPHRRAKEYDFKMYESFSAQDVSCISLTKESALKWNETQREGWFKYINNATKQDPEADEREWKNHIREKLGMEGEILLETYSPPLACAFTDTYGAIDETVPNQDASNPSMKQVKMDQEYPIAGLYFILIKECEGVRTPTLMPRSSMEGKEKDLMTNLAAGMMELQVMGDARLDPSVHGVRWNNETRVCKFTPDYCDRVGLKYTSTGADGNSDCKLWPGQEIAELIFGTTITRGFIRYGENPEDFGDDFASYSGVKVLYDPKGYYEDKKKEFQRYYNITKTVALKITNRAEEFAEDFYNDPVGAVMKVGKQVGNVIEMINPLNLGLQLTGSVACGGNKDCKSAVKAIQYVILPSQGFAAAVGSLDDAIGITSKLKDMTKPITDASKALTSALGISLVKSKKKPPPPTIFFQIAILGSGEDADITVTGEHNELMVDNEHSRLAHNTVAVYFTETEDDDGNKYWLEIRTSSERIRVEKQYPNEEGIVDIPEINAKSGDFFYIGTK